MLGNEHSISIEETRGILLGLSKKILLIDTKFEPEIMKLAEETVKTLPTIKESEREDYLNKIIFGSVNTFPVLHVDAFTLLTESQYKTERGLSEAIVSAMDGKDITQYTHAQNVELLRVLSLMSGYVAKFTALAEQYKNPSFDNSAILLFRYLIKKIKREQQKTFQISVDLLPKANKKPPIVKTYDFTLKPICGYTSCYTLPPYDYSDFCQDLKKTSDEWFTAGVYLAVRRFKQFGTPPDTHTWIV